MLNPWNTVQPVSCWPALPRLIPLTSAFPHLLKCYFFIFWLPWSSPTIPVYCALWAFLCPLLKGPQSLYLLSLSLCLLTPVSDSLALPPPPHLCGPILTLSKPSLEQTVLSRPTILTLTFWSLFSRCLFRWLLDIRSVSDSTWMPHRYPNHHQSVKPAIWSHLNLFFLLNFQHPVLTKSCKSYFLNIFKTHPFLSTQTSQH